MNMLLILAQFRWIKKLIIRFLGGIKISTISLLFAGFLLVIYLPRMNHYLDSDGPRNSEEHIRNFKRFNKLTINFLGNIRVGIISLMLVEILIYMVNCKPRVDWYSESDAHVRKTDGYIIIFDDCLFEFADGIYSRQLGLLVLSQVVVFDQLKF
eukprot:339367_1